MSRDARVVLEELERDPELVERLTRCLASHSYRSRAERTAAVEVVRDRVLAVLREAGTWRTVRCVATDASVGIPTARYHLSVLVDRGLAEERPEGGMFRAVEVACR